MKVTLVHLLKNLVDCADFLRTETFAPRPDHSRVTALVFDEAWGSVCEREFLVSSEYEYLIVTEITANAYR